MSPSLKVFRKCWFSNGSKNQISQMTKKFEGCLSKKTAIILRKGFTQSNANKRWFSVYETALAQVLQKMGWEIVGESESKNKQTHSLHSVCGPLVSSEMWCSRCYLRIQIKRKMDREREGTILSYKMLVMVLQVSPKDYSYENTQK